MRGHDLGRQGHVWPETDAETVVHLIERHYAGDLLEEDLYEDWAVAARERLDSFARARGSREEQFVVVPAAQQAHAFIRLAQLTQSGEQMVPMGNELMEAIPMLVQRVSAFLAAAT